MPTAAHAATEAEVRAWGTKIRDPSASLVERAHAMWGLRHAKEPLATQLLAAYVSEVIPPEPASNALLQHEAAYCLGQRGDPSAVPYLESTLRDTRQEAIVRHEAAEALAALASVSGVDTEHIKRVLTEFRGIDIVPVAETCEVGLGRVTWLQKSQKSLDPAAVRAKEKFPKTTDPSPAFDAPSPPVAELRRILQSPRESLFDRYQALFSLRNAAIVSLTNEVVDALSESVTAPGSALLRHEAAFLLGQLNITGTTDALIGRLSDASEAPMVRHESAISLGKVAATAGASGGEQDSLAKRARQALLEGSKDSEPVVRDSCVLALVMSDYSSSNEQFEIAETPSA